jgi:PDZ domain-containing protein
MVVAVLVVAVLVLNRMTVPYYALLPGEALTVDGPNGVIELQKAHPGSGDLFLTTVDVQNRVSEWDRLFEWDHPNTTLIKQVELTGGESNSQFNAETVQEMTDSQEFAKVAALRRLGYVIPEHGDGALVLEVEQGSAADGKLQPGDVITKVAGRPIGTATDATTVIRAQKPGVSVTIYVTRPGVNLPVKLSVTPGVCGTATCPTDPLRPLVGIALGTDKDSFDVPAKLGLTIDVNNIGGPSAGLAFTLGVLDALTTHDLTGGHKVAVTGTIDALGNVGAVGGVEQKTVAVYNQGCQYFLVPPDEYAAASAKAKGHHLTIVKVSTLDDALNFLRSIGGNLSGIPLKSPLTPV